jgi:putative membrane protein
MKGNLMRRALFVIAAVAATLVVAGGAGAQTDTVSEQDKSFLKGQQETNLAEISLGKIVIERATSAEVKALAEKLVADHTAVSELNKTLSSKLGIDMPEQPSAAQQATADKIKAQSGAAFDAAYVAAQVEGHTKSVASAQKEISSGSHPEVKAFATEYLPKAQMHLEHTKTTQAALGTETARDGSNLPRTGAAVLPLTAFGFALASSGFAVRRLSRRR